MCCFMTSYEDNIVNDTELITHGNLETLKDSLHYDTVSIIF